VKLWFGYILLAACLVPQMSMAGGIFSNTATSEDSIAISVHLTDSLGNPSGTQADSFYVSVIGPSGDSIMTLAGVASTGGLDIDSLNTVCLGWKYVYSEAISEIDGAGRPGTYELTFCAKDNSPEFVNCARTSFQVIDSHLNTQLADISVILDSLLAALDTLQNQDNWVSSFDHSGDTVYSDAVKISGDLPAADNFETMLDGNGGNRLTVAGVDIHATGNDTAVVIEASGTGTGLGLFVLGGGNGGEGVKIHGGNTKSALVAQAGASVSATHGFDLIGDGGGFGLNGSISQACRQSIVDAVWDEDTAAHQESGSFAVMLKDTAAYQGGASGLTAAEITDSVWGHILDTAWASGTFGDSASGWGATAASSLDSGIIQRINNRGHDSTQNAHIITLADGAVDAVWDETQSGHGTAGTFGAYLDAPISSIESPSGSGTYPVTVTAYDNVNSQVVPGVRISVYNSSLDALMALGITGSDGIVLFNLDSSLYIASAFAPGYIFAAYDSLIVVGATNDSINGQCFDPGNPSSPDLCRVYGFLYGIDGLPIEGVTVMAQLTEGVVRHGSLIISPYKRTAVSDSLGYFFIDMIPSASLNPSATTYLISATYPSGTILKKTLTVPDTSSWSLTW
jgi:hypothetical protein